MANDNDEVSDIPSSEDEQGEEEEEEEEQQEVQVVTRKPLAQKRKKPTESVDGDGKTEKYQPSDGLEYVEQVLKEAVEKCCKKIDTLDKQLTTYREVKQKHDNTQSTKNILEDLIKTLGKHKK